MRHILFFLSKVSLINIIFFPFSAAQVWKEVQQEKTAKKGKDPAVNRIDDSLDMASMNRDKALQTGGVAKS